VLNKRSTILDKDKDKDKDKEKKKKKDSPPTIKKIQYPFESEKFLNAWDGWKTYRKKEHGFKYKSEESEQAALMKLNRLSEHNEETAIKIIIQSIENGWKGHFELKSDYETNRRNKGASDREVAEILAKNFASDWKE